LIIAGGKRPGQIPRLRRKVLTADEVGRNGVAVGGQIVEHPAKIEQIIVAGFVAQGRLSFAQRAEPAEQMGIATELGEPAYLRKSSMKPGEEAASNAAIVGHAVGPQSQSESTEVRFKDLIEAGCGPFHTAYRELKCVRFSTARAYSRQTSCGASRTYSMVVWTCE